MMLLSKHLFEYVPKTIDASNIKSIKMNEDKTAFITYKDDSMEMVEIYFKLKTLRYIYNIL